MVQKTKELIDGFPTWIKYATSIVSMVVALAGGIYAMEDRYVSDADAAKSLKNFDIKIQQDFEKIELQILQNELENTTQTYFKHKQLIRAYPDDVELKEELIELKDRRDSIKSEISEKVGL